jgi:hypothetical protein
MLGEMGDIPSTNMYAYCANNPVMYSDSSGQFPILITLGIIFGIGALSGVAGTLIGDVVNATMTGEWTWSSWETYVGSSLCYGLGAIGMAFLGPAKVWQ